MQATILQLDISFFITALPPCTVALFVAVNGYLLLALLHCRLAWRILSKWRRHVYNWMLAECLEKPV